MSIDKKVNDIYELILQRLNVSKNADECNLQQIIQAAILKELANIGHVALPILGVDTFCETVRAFADGLELTKEIDKEQ